MNVAGCGRLIAKLTALLQSLPPVSSDLAM